MAKFILNQSDYLRTKKDGDLISLIKRAAFNKFNESILGLGNIDTKAEQTNALSVIFDLEGFTDYGTYRSGHVKGHRN